LRYDVVWDLRPVEYAKAFVRLGRLQSKLKAPAALACHRSGSKSVRSCHPIVSGIFIFQL
jgi:hypothetical protein